MSDSTQNQGYVADKDDGSYTEEYNGIVAPEGLATCLHLYSRQELFFLVLRIVLMVIIT